MLMCVSNVPVCVQVSPKVCVSDSHRLQDDVPSAGVASAGLWAGSSWVQCDTCPSPLKPVSDTGESELCSVSLDRLTSCVVDSPGPSAGCSVTLDSLNIPSDHSGSADGVVMEMSV